MSERPKIVIEITPPEDFDGEAFDPTPVLIEFISSINTIPPRELMDYGPVLPTYRAGCKCITISPAGVCSVDSDVTLVYNAPLEDESMRNFRRHL